MMTAPTDTRIPQAYEPVERRIVVERGGWVPTLCPGLVLGGLGAAGVIASLFAAWREAVSGFVPTGWSSRRDIA